ncbi:HlyD family secretion protein [Litoreibacter roseus]|uniref:Membrane fusion protein (Multidrug efflux system) n=1 Tax=Litoreibacter roseus TaxID=2601869 RepID=A0A6N6JNP1_9RHOB|nr:HlyD family secretion protein [Litoreibacter roseus]GFE67078.1 hypothetical protein KIN_41520 [Litoreibacter roseus]
MADGLHSGVKRVLMTIGFVCVFAALAVVVGQLISGRTIYVRTENAYVRSDIVTVAPRISGYAVEILVEDNTAVTAGQPLFQLDRRDFEAAVRQAEADVEIQNAGRAAVEARARLQLARISAAQSTVDARQAEREFAAAELARATELRTRGAGTQQRLEDATAADLVAAARLVEASADLLLEQEQQTVLEAERQSAEAAIANAEATLEKNRMALHDTTVWAPLSGTVASRGLRLGEFAAAGASAMSVVPEDGHWIEANIRETQIQNVRPGDRAEVQVDTLGGTPFCATVESVAPASGSEFSLIPPDNATGNFTKIVRRFTVRLQFDPDDPRLTLVRPGMSVVPTIAAGSHETGLSDAGFLENLLRFGHADRFACDTGAPVSPPQPLRRSLPVWDEEANG